MVDWSSNNLARSRARFVKLVCFMIWETTKSSSSLPMVDKERKVSLSSFEVAAAPRRSSKNDRQA